MRHLRISAAVSGRIVSGQAAGHCGDGRIGRGGRRVHADAFSGREPGRVVRDGAAPLGWRALELPASCFVLVGMGGMLAATTRSPLLAMIMVFEISLDYSLMPPLMLALRGVILLARRLHPESIYTEPLRAARAGGEP